MPRDIQPANTALLDPISHRIIFEKKQREMKKKQKTEIKNNEIQKDKQKRCEKSERWIEKKKEGKREKRMIMQNTKIKYIEWNKWQKKTFH